ncbi:MAG: sugar ABC transporter ATP-binding protein, partial [Caldilineales bacterium]|nr:sugar ABC transporter ATP-binding protein [Caldilineales bacterium]
MSDHHGPIIELHRISKRFPGVQALDDISLKIYPGEVHAVVGENGAGKSTLMNILAGELQPDAGHIVFRGEKRAIPNPFVSQQMGISVVYQELALCPNLSIAENVSLSRVAAARGLSFLNRREFNTRAREALASLGLEKVNLGQPVGQLTVAQQQLVEIAKAISGQARLLILDEPTSAVDTETEAAILQALERLIEGRTT